MNREKRVVVIGAGPGGIYTGIRLRQQGHTNFTVYEKQESLGGTWWRNRYPGNACDAPALQYSFEFQPFFDASRTYESGDRLYGYFHDLAVEHGLIDHVVFNTEVLDATWDGSQWNLTLSTGEQTQADVVISAVGRLHRPKYPDIPGRDEFEGLMVHSTYWDPETKLDGRRLGLIGSGSSGVQIMVEASKIVSRLDFFQRTPHWVVPVVNETVPEDVRRRRREDPEFLRGEFTARDARRVEAAESLTNPDTPLALERKQAILEALARVEDTVLREKITPDYAVGCKRLVLSWGYYESIQKPNVELITERIERIEPAGIRTADGVLHELDVIILATGFHADAYLRPMTVTGEGGFCLDDIWADSYQSYKSVALPHMPNLFTVNGPFSPGGSLPITRVIETHAEYILQLLDRIVAEDVAISPDPARTAELVTEIQERAKKTIWYTGGCTSWYLDANGVPLVNPLTLEDLRDDLKTPIWEDFVVVPRAAAVRSS